jgi:hypothetical protein
MGRKKNEQPKTRLSGVYLYPDVAKLVAAYQKQCGKKNVISDLVNSALWNQLDYSRNFIHLENMGFVFEKIDITEYLSHCWNQIEVVKINYVDRRAIWKKDFESPIDLEIFFDVENMELRNKTTLSGYPKTAVVFDDCIVKALLYNIINNY